MREALHKRFVDVAPIRLSLWLESHPGAIRRGLIEWSVVVAAFLALASVPALGRYIAAGCAGMVVYLLAEKWQRRRTYRQMRAVDRRLRRAAERQPNDQDLLRVMVEVLDS